MRRVNISVSMIALNEEKFIARALSSCTFADEIVVVDGGSADRTIELLQSHDKVKIVHHPWNGHFGNQRQICLQHCTGNWVIRLDADEAFSQTFEENIRELLERTSEDVAGYRVRQCNLVGNENYYSKNADKFESIPRIWRNKREIRWEFAIHESLTGFSGRILDWDIYVVHYGFLDKALFLEKAQRYSKIAGSLVHRVEDLVYRDYDFQPVPDQAKVAAHVVPFSLNGQHHRKPRIAMVRGPHLNLLEIRNLAPLQNIFDMTVFTTCPPPCRSEGYRHSNRLASERPKRCHGHGRAGVCAF
jgi:glycosyltransferase involved in cell wall biosynthesis